ncbi:MAG: Lrp/AsnC family transcriptional regulator [Denitrovibrio sp.]|nr:MAG: Lrp/AsnC family transcriptional regulator [Denitrovibrio sp.]
MRNQIDETDRHILNLLMDNARISYADIAKAVGMKSPSVIERIKRLEQIGIIKGYSANIDYNALGDDINAFIGVSMDNAKHIEEFEEHVRDIDPDLIGCCHVTGDYTFLLSVVTRNTQSLSNLIKKIRDISGVDKTNTILVFATLMDRKRKI